MSARTRAARYVVGSERLTVSEIASRAGVSVQCVYQRIRRGDRGVSLVAPAPPRDAGAATIDVGGTRLTVAQIARRAGVDRSAIYLRLRAGWTGADLLRKPRPGRPVRSRRRP